MNIKTKLSEKDFINANFVLLFSKVSTKIFIGIGTFYLFLIISLLILDTRHSDITQIIVPICLILGLPVLTYFGAKKNYSTNQRISENIEYRFDKDYLSTIGESFNSQASWDKIYKVTQSKNWVFIWHNRQIANPIPKRDIWEEQISELKNLLDSHNVKNNLT